MYVLPRQWRFKSGLFILLACAWLLQPGSANAATPYSLQGHVATILSRDVAKTTVRNVLLRQPVTTSLNEPIFLPNIDVWAKNIGDGVASPHSVTNPQGYFVIGDLREGRYQLCVSASGFESRCDSEVVTVTRPAQVLDHILEIEPAASAIAGTVWLADRMTPCFWFRSSMNPLPLLAKVSLIDPAQKVLAGPVSGNSAGQYVLPVTEAAVGARRHAVGTRLHIECEASTSTLAVAVPHGVLTQDVILANHSPTILSMDFTKGSNGIRRASPGEVVRVGVQASDSDGDRLHYHWVDETGRSLGLPDAPEVDWPLVNASGLNVMHVQVSDGKGGFATFRRELRSGPDAILFAGQVFDRHTHVPVANASISLNRKIVQSDAGGLFRVSVPDASQFVLNVNKPGFALASLIFRNVSTTIAVPLDAAQSSSISALNGGTIEVAPAGCRCRCKLPPSTGPARIGPKKHADPASTNALSECEKSGDGLSVNFPPGALVSATGARFDGAASVEAFQYDLSQPNPIPGDFGGQYQGKMVRLGTFGSFHLQPRDAQGKPLMMAPGQAASVSISIQSSQLTVAPPVIPLFYYDQDKGLWMEDGSMNRVGNKYIGQIKHFSAFNADTVFAGGACVKVVIDNSFTLPVTLNASYFDASVGSFHHPNTTSSDDIIGVERLTPFQNFNLTITDANSTSVTIALNSGAGLNTTQFPDGLDTDQVNFSHCNGPVQVYNNQTPAVKPVFLEYVTGGTIPININVNYRTATDANTGGSRDTLVHWKQANGFLPTPTGEAKAIYFNNGDLKFGRDMHCRVTNAATNALACYVSNFGVVGTDDAVAALTDADSYEASGQVTPQPAATVTMEYTPAKGVQFWAYHGAVGGDGGKYFASPALDSEGPKAIPNICMGCHQGTYSNSTTVGVVGAVFLPFDLDSFKDVTDSLFPVSMSPPSAALQQQFHELNTMIDNTNPPQAIKTLIEKVWYAGSAPTLPFLFNQGAAKLPPINPGDPPPFVVKGPPLVDHSPLYDNVVKEVCRTCHVAIDGLAWDSFALMNSEIGAIKSLACGAATQMPNAEVPWLGFWQNNRTSTLASELNLPGGCPDQ